EKRLEAVGPDGLRLQDLAADVGIGHPAILHHFGNREGLMKAVIARAVEKLQADLFVAISSDLPHDGAELFHRVFETLGDKGPARVMAWLLLSGYDPFDTPESRQGWSSIARLTHALRGDHFKAIRKTPPPYEDTLFAVIASSLTLFGAAIAGKSILR